MTVSSLWKLLDEAGCGKLVGPKEIANPDLLNTADVKEFNPRNKNALDRENRLRRHQILAIDLSIWICEALTSHAMSECHENPSLYLVFTRTMNLLNLGVKLIFVLDGKRRIRRNGQSQEHIRKRRSGTHFWNSCKQCRKVLEMLGVPVVQASCEGEALCALLSQRGIVDGVISNDSDCFLFGAKVIYTKFSIENLDSGSVVRYELQNLKGLVEPGCHGEKDAESGIVSLSRYDLIAFALLTGSDLAGNGFHKVGYKKAIRFIRKCQFDNPSFVATAAIDEMQSWARASKVDRTVSPDTQSREHTHRCTRCCHSGTKRDHMKRGCKLCGSEPGEPCFKMTREDQFRQYLRRKALAMHPKFDPSLVLNTYMQPNGNLIPLNLAGGNASNIPFPTIDLDALIHYPFPIKGMDLRTSRVYVKDSVTRYIARAVLINGEGRWDSERIAGATKSKVTPTPSQIVKRFVKNLHACYEVRWSVAATLSDDTGDGINGYEFTTIEDGIHFKNRFPSLVATYEETEKARVKQGDTEENRRKRFLDNVVFRKSIACRAAEEFGNERASKRRALACQKRQAFFRNGLKRYEQDYFFTETKCLEMSRGEDVYNLLRFVSSKKGTCKTRESPPVTESTTTPVLSKTQFKHPVARGLQALAECDVFCHMGDLEIPMTPIKSHHGHFPPQYIYVTREL